MMIKKVQIGIIGAMDIELHGFLSRMSEREEVSVGGIDFYYGKLEGKEVALAVCGVGKVFASMCAQTMILSFSPDIIINTGVAGTLNENIGIGDMVIATDVIQHDMDTSALGDPIGLISGINVVSISCDKSYAALIGKEAKKLGIPFIYGRVASGDQFVCERERKDRIKELFSADACEMEGAAIGQVCYVNRVPFCVLRAISDGGDESACMDFPKFAKMAAERAVGVLCAFLSSL